MDWELKLTAFRPEPDRYLRLAQVLDQAYRAIHSDGYAMQWDGALNELNDRKGDLTATWRNDADIKSFAHFIDSAWAAVGEDGDDVVHEVLAE